MQSEQWRQEMHDFIVKSTEKKGKVDEEYVATLLDKLMHSEFLIEPRWAKISEDLAHELQLEFSEFTNIAVIPMGSAIHGGAFLRQVTQHSTPGQVGDFDWGLATDQDIAFDDPILSKINTLAKRAVPQLAQEAGVEKNMESCSRHNAKYFRVKNLESVEEAYDHLLKTADNYIPDQDPFFQIFQPSFPAEVNQRNQEMFLEALRQLAKQDSDLWEVVAENLVQAWERVHRIHGKHLIDQNSSDKAAVKKANELAEYSGRVMSQVFTMIIGSTRQ